ELSRLDLTSFTSSLKLTTAVCRSRRRSCSWCGQRRTRPFHVVLGGGSRDAMKVAVLGASGSVWRLVVRRLLSYRGDVVEQIVLLSRRLIEDGVIPHGDARLISRVVDMSSGVALERAAAPLLRGIDVVVSTMGVGSGKGAADLFRRVEVELPSAFAR